eukprot:TRINITY_DN104249_c0_g1_i1.p1 TRINITY_DN104249_c0_g1~~TRINITY_DN104249_c0_g1_i1.p1  ORF type:complete len:412 (+),score=39.69 TRINITY_DN104249_c0_g1_i1:20-1255(+)
MPHPVFGSSVPFAEPQWYRTGESPYYDKTHVELRQRIREFVEREVRPYTDEWEKNEQIPAELFRKAADAGIYAVPYDPSAIGFTPKGNIPKFDPFHDLVWLDELARTASSGIAAGFSITTMALPPILWFGSKYIKERVLPDVLSAKKFIALCVSEPYAGSDVANLRTRAVRDGDHYILNGQKKWITRGVDSHFFTVACRTGGEGAGGLSMLLVERDMPGVKVRKLPLMGNRSAGTAFITFDDVKVPVKNLIGKENEGFKCIMINFNHERFVIAAQALRGCRLALEITIEYARKRRTFGKRLIDHQVIRHKVMEMGLKIETTHALMEHLCYQWKEGVPMAELAGQFALLKMQSTKTTEFCARECSQIYGGASYVAEGQGAPIERFVRDARAMAIYGGADEIMMDLAARQAKL